MVQQAQLSKIKRAKVFIKNLNRTQVSFEEPKCCQVSQVNIIIPNEFLAI